MIQISPQMRILVAVEAVDFRKGIDGLARVWQEKLQSDPYGGWLFVFRNRRGTAMKALTYDSCEVDARLCFFHGRFDLPVLHINLPSVAITVSIESCCRHWRPISNKEDSMLILLFPNTHTRYTSLPVLGEVLEDLCLWLESQGYPPSAICRRVEAAPFLDYCLRQCQIHSLSGCTATQLRACFPRRKRWTPQIAYALGRSLLQYLEERSELAPTALTPSEQLIRVYREHLERVRGLAASTIERHSAVAGDFLRFLRYDKDVHRLLQIQFVDLETFVAEASARVGRITMQKVIAILRSFLRFLAVSGKVPVGLDRQLESPRHHRGERLVRALPWKDVLLLLQTIDRSTTKGARDYGMLLLIATYGLRRSEVASLTLDDIEWRARVIHVPRPKVGESLALPLTDEVATALISYLRLRSGEVGERHLFLRVRAPQGPILPTAVSDAFDFWASSAGIHVPGSGGPHCLRHALAMHLLRQGAPLKTIGDLLGHRSAESTGVYLRLQIEDLRDVALPLPMGNSCMEVRP